MAEIDDVVSPPYPDPLESLPFWGRGPEEDITRLPSGWDARVTPEGRVFFVNHNERDTQWPHPTTKMKYRVQPYLAYGWQLFRDDDDTIVYVDITSDHSIWTGSSNCSSKIKQGRIMSNAFSSHLDGVCTKVDPRLLNKMAYDFPEQYGIRSFNPLQHRLKPYSKADDVLENIELQGKVAIVTGANSGLGFETARCLASHGAHVILACRDRGRGMNAVKRLQDSYPSARIEYRDLDLGSLRSVKLFSEFFIASGLPLHILVCNAGIFEPDFHLSEDGLERQFAVNYLGHFFLIKLLMNELAKSKPSRVIIVSSESHWYPAPKSSRLDLQILQHPSHTTYNAFAAYGSSKLCCLLLTQHLHRQYTGDGISFNAVHPGNLLPTQLMRKASCMYKVLHLVVQPLTSSVPQAASSIVFCAAHPLMEGISGLYIYRCAVVEPSHEAQSHGTAAALWELSEQIIKTKMTKWETI